MKRSRLRRTRGLVRSPLTIKGKRSSTWHRSRQWCFDRAHDHCEAAASPDCTHRAEHAHHMLMRSQGGADDPSNLLAVCAPCHEHIHAHPEDSYERGFLRHREAS